jgi:hypothetical protein
VNDRKRRACRFGVGTFNRFPPKVYPAIEVSFVNLPGRCLHRWTLIDFDVPQWRGGNALSK